jgi:hypothetical protein
VYCLTLRRDVDIFHDVEEYWIDPVTFLILKQQAHFVRNWGSHTQEITRATDHSPRIDGLPPGAVIEFGPTVSNSPVNLNLPIPNP